MRKLVQIFVGVIVDVVGQFVDKERRTVGRAEETT